MDSLTTSTDVLMLPKPGNEEEWILELRPISSTGMFVQYKCRYGSSLKILAQGERLITEEFTSSNPNKDWKKYQKEGKELMYCIIENMADDEVVCAARAILDFPCVASSKKSKITKRNISDRKRIILDYIHTCENCRGQGLAAEVVRFLQRIANAEGTDFYVLALEETQGYFLAKFDMILEQDPDLRESYNCFSDTFLLKSPNNVSGSKSMTLDESFLKSESEEEDGEEINASEDEDNDFQRALTESLKSDNNALSDLNGTLIPSANSTANLMTEQQQLEYAMRLSMTPEVHSTTNLDKSNATEKVTVENALNKSNDSNKNALYNEDYTGGLSEDDMLEQAIALSLQTTESEVSTEDKSDE